MSIGLQFLAYKRSSKTSSTGRGLFLATIIEKKNTTDTKLKLPLMQLAYYSTTEIP
jgi:hypothetical protein